MYLECEGFKMCNYVTLPHLQYVDCAVNLISVWQTYDRCTNNERIFSSILSYIVLGNVYWKLCSPIRN